MAEPPVTTTQRDGLARGDLYRQPPVRHPVPTLVARLRRLFAGRAAREEQMLQARLRAGDPQLGEAARIAFVSPKGGAGKTTCALLAGEALCGHPRLRVVAVDANPDSGTLAFLAPKRRRADRWLTDLPDATEPLGLSAALPFVSVLDSGLHLLAGPARARHVAGPRPERYDRLRGLLAGFCELILIDLGTGVGDPIACLALTRADLVVMVRASEWVTADRGLEALDDLEAAVSPSRVMAVLDAVTYDPGRRPRPTRVAVKRLGLMIGEQLW